MHPGIAGEAIQKIALEECPVILHGLRPGSEVAHAGMIRPDGGAVKHQTGERATTLLVQHIGRYDNEELHSCWFFAMGTTEM